MKRINLYDIIELERKTLSFFGVYSGRKYQSGKRHKITFAIGMLFAWTFIGGMIGKMIEQNDNFEVFFEIIHLLTTQTTCAVKTVYFYFTLSQFNDLEERLEDKIFNLHTPEQNPYVAQAVFMFRISRYTYRGLAFTAAFAYSVCPILDGDILAVPIWCPFDIPKIYLQLYESICLFWLGTVHPSIILLSVAMMAVTTAELDILNDNLRRATDRNDNEDFQVQERKIQARLKRCIKHHLATKSFTAKSEAVFSLAVFLQIFASIGSICMTGLEFLRVPIQSASIISVIVFFFTMLTQIGITCCLGQAIISKSEEIRDACYLSEWYACSTSTKKMLFIVMEISKREMVFRAGSFFDMSLATYVMIIRNAYSYFAVLVKVL